MAWGPWIEHDGKGCPCLGQLVQAMNRMGTTRQVVAGSECIAKGLDPSGKYSAWVWGGERFMIWDEIVRYRVHKPKGMEVLERIAKTTRVSRKEPVAA